MAGNHGLPIFNRVADAQIKAIQARIAELVDENNSLKRRTAINSSPALAEAAQRNANVRCNVMRHEMKKLQALIDELEGIRQRLSDLLHNTKHCASQIWPDDLAHALYGDDWEAKVREVGDE